MPTVSRTPARCSGLFSCLRAFPARVRPAAAPVLALTMTLALTLALHLVLLPAGTALAAQPAGQAAVHRPPAAPAHAEHVEVWTGSVLSATFRVGMCMRPDGALRGVFLLTHKNGDTDTYHIYGRVTDNTFKASHASGHTFWGDLSDPGTVHGKMRIKRGMRFSFEGKRHYNARVSADCTPLP